MIRFRSNSGYKQQPDDASSSSSDGQGVIPSESSPPPSPPPLPPTERYQQPKPQLQVVTESSNADTIMDLAATIPSSKVLYQMDEKKNNSVAQDEEVERIVSAVTKGLRRKKSSSRNKSSSKKTGNGNKTPVRSLKTALQSKLSKKNVVPKDPKEEPLVRNSSIDRAPNQTTIGSAPMGVEVVPVISDDDNSKDKTPKRSHRPKQKKQEPVYSRSNLVNDSVASSAFTDDVDYNYNYIDDESYGDSSSSSSSYSSSDSTTDSEGDDSDSESSDESTASLTDEVDSSFDNVMESKSSEDKPHDEKTDTYRADRNAPRGLDIVGNLLAGATEISLDAHSIMNSGSRGTSAQTIARHVSEALSQTSNLQKVSFCGPWKGQSNKARLVLEILFDGLLTNTSVHTFVLKDNHCLDRYAGYAFGTFLKAHNSNGGSMQKLEIVHCNFLGSGWSSLFLGLQHSPSIKRLSVVDCENLSSDDFDCITSTIHYLSLEHLKLCNINLHKSNIENLSFLFRAMQQTKTLKEVDLSRNNLGGTPRAILLLSRCLSGDPVWIEAGGSKESETLPFNYHHHIEKLTLVDCGIADKASVRTLSKAMDSTLTKLDANNNEHKLVLHSVDLGKNNFGNNGAKILKKLLENNASITTLGMVGCGVSTKNLKTIADQLRYNNSFLQKLGLSSGVSLAILDSMSAVESVFSGRKTTIERTESIAMANEEDDSDLEASSRMSACGGC